MSVPKEHIGMENGARIQVVVEDKSGMEGNANALLANISTEACVFNA